ncbi:MAG: LamG-like jellyroll fold domain-containing protein, partial [Candidatus Sulfotelmatobacter sp.]
MNDGILFGKYGSVVSAGSFKLDSRRSNSSWSLEIWLEPKRVHASGTILAFYQPERQFAPFALRQSLGDLELLRQKKSGQSGKTYVDDIFSRQKPVLVAVTSGPSGTTVFADGEPVRKFDDLKVSSQDLTGRLIIGNSPVTTDEWSGQLKGLTIYDRELTA